MQAAEQAIHLIIDAGGEVEGVLVASGGAVAEGQGPEAVDGDRLSRFVLHQSQESAGRGIVGGDPAAAEIADEQCIAELSEVGGSKRDSPGSVEPPSRFQP